MTFIARQRQRGGTNHHCAIENEPAARVASPSSGVVAQVRSLVVAAPEPGRLRGTLGRTKTQA